MPGTGIARAAPFPWPPRSQDLISLDFFLWGFVKNQVYKVTKQLYFAVARLCLR